MVVLLFTDKRKGQAHQVRWFLRKSNRTSTHLRCEQQPLAEEPPQYEADSSTSYIQKAWNYISVERTHESIKGTFVVDPAMTIPQAMLPRRETEYGWTSSKGKNVELETSTGSIDATIIVVNRGNEIPTNDESRTTLGVKTKRGSIAIKLVSVILSYFHLPHPMWFPSKQVRSGLQFIWRSRAKKELSPSTCPNRFVDCLRCLQRARSSFPTLCLPKWRY
jgi:hypothetical protein